MHFQFSLIFHPFYPSCLTTLFISLCFSFSVVWAAASLLPVLSRIQGQGEAKSRGLSALPLPGWSRISLLWLCADTPLGVQIKKFKWVTAEHGKIRIFLKLNTKADFSDYWHLREGVKIHTVHGIYMCQAHSPHSKAMIRPSLVQTSK